MRFLRELNAAAAAAATGRAGGAGGEQQQQSAAAAAPSAALFAYRIEPILKARVPICKFKDAATGVSVDLSFDQPSALLTSLHVRYKVSCFFNSPSPQRQLLGLSFACSSISNSSSSKEGGGL